MDDIRALLRSQDGVASRAQLLAAGLEPWDVARMLRRRELSEVHRGVYAEHTGPLTWKQRAWAATLACARAALSHQSAIAANDGAEGERADAVIHVAVDRDRHLQAPSGVRLHRLAGVDARIRWNTGPPRVRYEHAVLDVAAAAVSDRQAVARLADACGALRTTAPRLLEALAERRSLRRRAWLAAVLADVAEGTCSVLEHGYLVAVERPHGLPVGRRQVSHRHGSTSAFHDVEYDEAGLVVELDGRLFHSSAEQRDLDMDRDLDAAVNGVETLRVSFTQVHDRPCATAARIAAVLRRRGWTGDLTPCPGCGVPDAPGASGTPQPPLSGRASGGPPPATGRTT